MVLLYGNALAETDRAGWQAVCVPGQRVVPPGMYLAFSPARKGSPNSHKIFQYAGLPKVSTVQ